MSTPNSRSSQVPSSRAMVPRRTLRKGTRSCIECKKRKTRCSFLSVRDASCVGCQRRGTECLGQEYFDEPALGGSDSSRVPERLARVERLLATLLERASRGELDDLDARLLPAPPRTNAFTPESAIDTRSARASSPHRRTTSSSRTETPPRSVSAQSRQKPWDDPTALTDEDSICRRLLEALPSQHDIEIILTTGRASTYLLALFHPYAQAFGGEGTPSGLANPFMIPSLPCHPLLLARCHLQLALCIQGQDPAFDASVLQMLDTPHQAKERYMHLASSLVTSQDDHLDSLEGLECLVLEGAYLINEGSLRRALLHFRRAITLAHLLGLHHPRPSTTPPRKLRPQTQIPPAAIWRRLVYAERYLSLLLGLPTATAGATILPSPRPTATERVEDAHTLLFARILSRNALPPAAAAAETTAIETALTALTTNVPAAWWAPPALTPDVPPEELMARVVRAQSQLIHFNLRAVLHLGALLGGPRGGAGRAACVAACREGLRRWVGFRGVVRTVFCCRWVDFGALTAAMAVVLGLLEGRAGRGGGAGGEELRLGLEGEGQRAVDRELVEEALGVLDELNKLNGDGLSRQTAAVARRLLVVEAEAAAGGSFVASSHGEDDGESVSGMEMEGRLASFPVKIPYFGTVNVRSQDAGETEHQSDRLGSTTMPPFPSATPTISTGITATSSLQSWREQQHEASESAAPDPIPWQQWPANQEPFAGAVGTTWTEHAATELSFGAFMQSWHGKELGSDEPDLLAGPEDWAFQGVDVAFLDAVLQTGHDPQGQFSDNWDVDIVQFSDPPETEGLRP